MGQKRRTIALWVIIPAFNAGPVIGGVVMAVRTLCDNIVVFDDCSGDDTGVKALEAGATVLRHANTWDIINLIIEFII
jgi:glycosyltransferase involved in cell wall biosynthesis